ncbi:MAG: chemotaxis protein CheW [Solirubrobacterales bacterium]
MEVQMENGQSQEVQIVAFKLGSEEYGVDILAVQEIIKVLEIARVPKSNPNIEGVINLRGNVIPVFNLHRRFGIAPAGREEDARIIVFQFDEVKTGIIVDGVTEVLRIYHADIEDARTVYHSMDGDFIQGVGKVDGRLLILLDLEKLLGVH